MSRTGEIRSSRARVRGALSAARLWSAVCSLLIAVSLGSAQEVTQATLTVDAGRVEGRISPLLYGQFMEFMFEDIKGGLYAELIRNRSFEEAPNVIGLSREWDRYPDDRNDDFALNFHWDDAAAYPAAKSAEGEAAQHSTRVDAGEGAIPRHGLYQSRVPVREGLSYSGYLWLKTDNYKGRVTLALEADRTGGEVYAEAHVDNVGGDWRRYAFTLKPSKSDPLARLAILFEGRGRLWIDQVSLLPNDAVGGVRADVFEKIKALRPAFVRWPGGNVAQDYHWQWGIGARDQRPTWTNRSWKNEPEPSDFGTDEYIEFCRRIGAEPSITVNVEGGGATAAEAAAWVEYCNGPATSQYGAMRARNGHPEPYHVKFWEIGNEIWGEWVRGHSDAETYGRNFNRYSEAMRAVDPTIKFIAVGDNDMNWNRAVLRLAGPRIDYLAIHHYYGSGEMHGDPLNLMARPLFYEHFYDQVRALINEVVPGRDIKLSINEWNTGLPLPRQHSMESALYGARLMNVFERQGDLVALSAVSDLVNGWPGGIIQASRHGLFTTPTYHVIRLYNDHLGTQRLATRVESQTFDTTREGRAIPYLDVVASRALKPRDIFIKAINTDQARAMSLRINVTGAKVLPAAEIETLTAAALSTANSFMTPDAVTVKHSRLNWQSGLTVVLPKHSVSVITLRTAD
ncbi:MAG TPA: alpha-L-arabinofuranosidase C-terminal domain-containing protein [Pyrinomonadaceae bacterium]|nr:alpha-L-arabinofuranosidase C-terminal domain-containing protein [Pyrinomonadaceae bacterium]